MNKKLLFSIVILLFSGLTSLKAQNEELKEAKLDSILDVILFEDEEIISLLSDKTNFQFLHARTNFENQTYFAGRDIGIDQQTYTAQLTYFHSLGISLGLGGIWYSEFDPRLYATSMSLGWSGRFIQKSKDYRYRASFDRYFFSKNDSIDHSFNSAFSVGATIDKDFIGTRLDLSLLTGDETAGNISWDIYGDIKLFKLGSKYDYVKFEPEVSLYFGTEMVAYYELVGRGPNRQYNLIENSKFGMLNAEIMLPISIDYKDFDLEIGYNINLPHSMFEDGEDLPVITYFNVSLGYIFSLN